MLLLCIIKVLVYYMSMRKEYTYVHYVLSTTINVYMLCNLTENEDAITNNKQRLIISFLISIYDYLLTNTDLSARNQRSHIYVVMQHKKY